MLNTVLPTKSDAEETLKALKMPDKFPSDWALSNSDYQLILDAVGRYGEPLDANVGDNLTGLQLVLGKFVFDGATFKIITSGYSVFNGTAHFEEEDDAVIWLNENGCDCSDWGEARQMSEAEEIEYCWWDEWELPFTEGSR